MSTRLLSQPAAHDAAPKRRRPCYRVLARALTSSLDRDLAAGRPPRSSHALAIRAGEIVSPAERRELAQRWANVVDQARRPPVPRSPRAPLRRGVVIAARPDLREMISVLIGGRPIDARGAAMASWLLRDGTGPLYNRRSPVDLGAAVREATRQMELAE
ncbi:MAG TPA: hypothetical protein VEH05_17490 [Streptosporangiaceae bacterium]|nr:hypothetical protein [Streptosporangiaceae bacterium]